MKTIFKIATAWFVGLACSASMGAQRDQTQAAFESVAKAAGLEVESSLAYAEPDGQPHALGESILTEKCEVSMRGDFAQKASVDAIAWVFGHELAHCALKHGLHRPLTQLPAFTWGQEYDADKMGASFAAKAGFDAQAGMREALSSSIQSGTHPSAQARAEAIAGKPRYFPILVGGGPKTANAMVMVDGQLMLTRVEK